MSRTFEIVSIVAVILLIIIVLPFLYTQTSLLPDYSDTGEIGDTIQGISGPFISGLSALLVHLASQRPTRSD